MANPGIAAVPSADDVPGDVAAADGTSESIKRTLVTAFNRLVQVKVVTIVSKTELDVRNANDRTSADLTPFNKEVDALVTVVNLIDGDVINVIAPGLKDDAEMRAFHTAQVEKSMAVLPANIEAMVNLGKAIVERF